MKRQEKTGGKILMRCMADSEKRDSIIKAADIKNETYSKFMIDAAYDKAQRVLRKGESK